MNDQTTNAGALLLQEKLSARGAQKDLATEWSVDPGMVSRWCSGKLRPGAGHRLRLQERFGIAWELWDEDRPIPEHQGAA